ncbi:MAG: O-antigen ligase family protein [Tepidisphaeraceae bacterium]
MKKYDAMGTKRQKSRIDGDADKSPAWASLLTSGAFCLTLALVVARALMSEVVRDPFDVVVKGSPVPRGPGAATTLVLNALCCLPALLVLLRRAVDRAYVTRWTGSHLLLALLATWAAVSVAWSSDRFVTLVSASNMIAAAALVWATAQLVRSWLRLRVVAGVCVGLLLAYTASGLIYRYVQVEDNRKFWVEHKPELLQERGIEPDSYSARQLERKFIGGEMIGFNNSPNSYAAVIVLLMVVSAGVAIQRYASSDGAGGWMPIALAFIPTLLVLYHTHTRTAIGTLFLATVALMLLASSRLGAWLRAHRKLAYGACICIVLLGAAALVGHGLYHGSLPNDSLNFRWRYWVAASKLFVEHPFTGVGWGNFGPHYLSVRLPAAAEEIRDPHNFLVRGFAELGIVGGLLMLAWLERAAWELTRPIVPSLESREPQSTTTNGAAPFAASPFVAIALIAIGGIAINLIAGVDWSQAQAYLTLEVFSRLLWLGLLGVGMVLVTIRSPREQRLDDRPAPWVLYAALIGLGAFFLHNLVDFVLAEPGALTLLAVVLGAAGGVRTPSVQGRRPRRGAAIALLIVGAAVWLIVVIAVVIPVIDAEQTAAAADEQIRSGRPDAAAGMLENAYKIVPWNADYAFRSARALMLAGTPPPRIKAMLDVAIATDRTNVMYLQTRAEYEMRLPMPDAPAALADFERALKLDPNNVPTRLDYAAALAKFNQPPAAVAQFRESLRRNDLLDATEPERLTRERIGEIEKQIVELGSLR